MRIVADTARLQVAAPVVPHLGGHSPALYPPTRFTAHPCAVNHAITRST
jgi:hypothetical protein